MKTEKGESADRVPSPRSPSIDFKAIDRLDFHGRYVHTLSLKLGTADGPEYTINPIANPKTIDIRGPTANSVVGELLAVGIYDLQGDRLRVCLAEHMPMLKGEQRPTNFAVDPHSGEILFTLERYRPSEDDKAFPGRWTVTSEIKNGEPHSERDMQWKALVFAADSRFAPVLNETFDRRDSRRRDWSGRYFVDAKKQPKSVTLFMSWDAFQSRRGFSAIYKFDGDRLTIAFGGGFLPEAFESKPGSHVTLLVLERAKPAPGPKPEETKTGESQALPGHAKPSAVPTNAPRAIEPKPSPELAVAVLDDCDPDYKGSGPHGDGIRLLAADGQEVYIRKGLNNCQTIGANHGVTIDAKHGRVIFRELVDHRVTGINFAGKTLFQTEIKAGSLAVSPQTGDLWCLTGGAIGEGNTVVLGRNGARVHTYPISGFDLAYDSHDDAFWIVGKEVMKINQQGEVLFRGPKAGWSYVSVAPNTHDGSAWVVERGLRDVLASANRLLLLDSKGGEVRRLELEGRTPFGVACDPETGAAWVVILRKGILRVPVKGEPLPLLDFPAVSIAIGPDSGQCWIGTPNEVLRLDKEGKVLVRYPLGSESGQSWLSAP